MESFSPKDVLLGSLLWCEWLKCVMAFLSLAFIPNILVDMKIITKHTHYSQDYLANQYSCSSTCHPRNSQEVQNNDVKESAQRLWLKQNPFLLLQYLDVN